MASVKRVWTISLACGSLILCGRAVAQIAPGQSDQPIAVDADKVERFDAEHKTVYTGEVEAVQRGKTPQDGNARLTSDILTVYSYGPGEGPNAAAAPPGKPASAKPAAAPDPDSGDSVKQIVAEGHVFYVTQDQTVRGEHGVYDAEPDLITVTGNVIVVQGKNVARGDKMVIDRKTNHTTLFSNTTGRNNPNRVHGVFYNQNGQGQTAAPAPAAPAKKP